MATTSAILRQRLSEALGDWFSGTVDSGSTTTVVDAAGLPTLTEVDDGIQGWMLISVANDSAGVSGAPAGEIRRLLAAGGYDSSATEVNVSSVYTAEPAAGDTYELHRIDPAYKQAMINRSIEELFPLLYLPIIDQSNVAHSLLTDGGFEQWSSTSALTHWTKQGSPTLAQKTSAILFSGKSCLTITYAAAGNGVYQDVTPMQGDLADAQATIGGWVWSRSTTATQARLGISFDGGSTYTYTDYHTGDAQWEWLEKVVEVPDTAQGYRFLCSIEAAGTAYYDQVMVHFGQKRKRYPIISTILLGPHRVSQQAYASLGDGPYDPVSRRNNLQAGRSIRLEGMGLLSRPSTDAGTVEVDGARVDLIVAKAAHNLYRSLYSQSTGDSRNDYRELVDYWATEVDALSRRPGVRMTAMSAQIPEGWHVEEDADGKYLVID